MPGGRAISGADVRAALRGPLAAGVTPASTRALCEAVAPEDAFLTLEELRQACPPERIGLAPGAYAALFAPLFGEFE